MKSVEYKLYESDEECAWVLSECLEGSLVSMGVAKGLNNDYKKMILIIHQGDSYIIPPFLAKAVTYVFVEAVNHKVVDKFTEVFFGLYDIYTEYGYDIGVVEKVLSRASQYIESFEEVL